MRVAVVSGSWPPAICGVGDYAANLVDSLREAGIDAQPVEASDWSWGNRRDIARAIERLRPDAIHVQYPTRGFGASRIPAWLVWKWRRRAFVTLHEYSAQVGPPLAGIVPRGLPHYWPFSLAGALVFTNDLERERYLRIAPWARARTYLIGIASNIPRGRAAPRRNVVTYFGQIAPQKGIEEFVATAAALRRARSALEAEIVGGVPAAAGAYAAALRPSFEAHDIRLVLNAPAQDVADRLASSSFVLLPFPDGASEKRGSLLAALDNGALVLTRHKATTAPWIRACTIAVRDARDAVRKLLELEANPERVERLRERASSSAPRLEWRSIASAHAAMYAAALRRVA
jgi:glycosyltransferase involved in cell wall biosynthesis